MQRITSHCSRATSEIYNMVPVPKAHCGRHPGARLSSLFEEVGRLWKDVKTESSLCFFLFHTGVSFLQLELVSSTFLLTLIKASFTEMKRALAHSCGVEA